MALQDHFAALNYIRDQIKPAPRPHPEVLDWSKLIVKVSETKATDAGNVKKDSELRCTSHSWIT
jgi:hypothetical protein